MLRTGKLLNPRPHRLVSTFPQCGRQMNERPRELNWPREPELKFLSSTPGRRFKVESFIHVGGERTGLWLPVTHAAATSSSENHAGRPRSRAIATSLSASAASPG